MKDLTLTFGKYKGRTLLEVVEFDPGYIIWLEDNVNTIQIPEYILDLAFEMEEEYDADWWDMF